MSKWLIIYSSLTGNTKKIAEKIYESAGDADIFDIKSAPKNFSDYEVVALGYWLKRGAPDPLMTELLPKIHDTKVILFQTHGTEKFTEHSITAFARAGYLLGENCKILGTFSCQGKINPALIEKRMKSGENDPHLANIDRWKKAADHPNEEDLQDAANFVETIKRKILILKKYE